MFPEESRWHSICCIAISCARRRTARAAHAKHRQRALAKGVDAMAFSDPTELIRRYLEDVWNGGNVDAISELVDPGLRDHDTLPGRPAGPAGIRDGVARLRA